MTKRDRGMAQLARPDGRPLYSVEEERERQQALQASVDELVSAKLELTYTEVDEATAPIEVIDAQQANLISRLNADELARAANLRGFVEADLQRFSPTDIRPQIDAALAGKDRGLQAAWWHGLLGRVSDLDREAQGRQRSEAEIAERQQLVNMIDQLLAALGDPKLAADRKVQQERIDQARHMRRRVNDVAEPARIDALTRELAASGRYQPLG